MSKGGESLDWAVRISFYLGGIESASVKKLTATSGGREYKYGTKTKIQIEKNHVDDLTYEGEICSTRHGFWDPDKLDEYKKIYAKEIKEIAYYSKSGKKYNLEEFFFTLDPKMSTASPVWYSPDDEISFCFTNIEYKYNTERKLFKNYYYSGYVFYK